MRFDDRLKTVLDSPVADARDRAVRWRQLVDLLSRARADSDPELLASAIEVARNDRESVPDTVRAATARSIAGRPLDPRLVALFASDRLEVAAPVLAGATLDGEARREVAEAASEEVRRFFFALEGPGGLPILDEAPPPVRDSDAAQGDAQSEPSIGEVVAKIEKLRREREPASAPPAEPAPVQRKEIALFRWESDALGAIAWVEGAPRAALIGRTIAGHAGEALLDERCRELVARRAPFADMPLASTEPFGGEWRVSGAPAFAPGDGRFIGYRGIARRTDLTPAQRAAAPRAFEGADTLREMIHEIKTPLNAIIGFAEIIDGQYLGPAHRRYRERAADILGQARELLSAIEELDFAAKLQSNRAHPGEGSDFAQIFPKLVEQLGDYGRARGIAVSYRLRSAKHRCAFDAALSDRLLRRFLTSLIDGASNGEAISIEVGAIGRMCSVAVMRPPSFAGKSEADLLNPAFVGASGGAIGVGFGLRLVRGLARIAGGDLTVDAKQLTLLVPARG